MSQRVSAPAFPKIPEEGHERLDRAPPEHGRVLLPHGRILRDLTEPKLRAESRAKAAALQTTETISLRAAENGEGHVA